MRDLVFLLANSSLPLNLGDRLLQDALRDALLEYGAAVRVQSDPDAGTGGDRAARGRALLAVHVALLKHAVLGRLARDARATVFLPPGQALPKSLAALPRVVTRLVYLSLLRAMGIRIVSLGRDFSARSAVERLQEVGISHLAAYYGLRDESALRRARGIGVRNARWFPDLSWLSPNTGGSDPRMPAERTRVVLCFRDPSGLPPVDRRRAGRTLERVMAFMDEARDLGLTEFEYVCHHDEDRHMGAAIQGRSSGRHHLMRRSALASRQDIARCYGGAALILTNRLHAILLGLQWGAVGLALIDPAAQEKIRGQLLDIGLGDLIVDVGAPGPAAGALRSALDRYPALGEAVAAYRDRAVTSARLAFAGLFR